MKGTIKSKKWYGRFWLPERKKIKLMQAIYDYYEPEIQQKWEESWHEHLLYGTPLPTQPKDTKGSTAEVPRTPPKDTTQPNHTEGE